ncbi:MAG: rhomboid family intramembrane serine protease [Desulfobacteraceae bacterium]|nr:MAG: rhomboid family intramembrane serine protease [Desulfobacteraceae bacterium]
MNRPSRNSILCPNCRKLISEDESRCPFCGIQAPGSRWKNNPLTRGWGSGEQIIRTIIYANVGMYLFSLLLNPRRLGLGFNPLGLLAPDQNSLAVLGATGTFLMNLSSGWWTLLSANYLHGSIFHIFFNMIALYQIGPLVTQLYGPYRFFAIYTLSGIGGFWISFMAGIPLTLGASAALCGLIGAALYYGKHRGGLFGLAIYKQVGGWALFILLFGFLVPGINNWAHMGGMAAGALCGVLLGYQEKSREKLSHRLIAAGCLAVSALALAWGVLQGVYYWIQ